MSGIEIVVHIGVDPDGEPYVEAFRRRQGLTATLRECLDNPFPLLARMCPNGYKIEPRR